MKPVLILQHLSTDGPAYLATWLAARGLPMDVRNTQAGQAYPPSVAGHGALAILGGEMSANDPLPSLRQAEALIREAMALGIPVLGHCLGGQLMARALGATVRDSPAPEIGWQPMELTDTPEARRWFGDGPGHQVMHWHYESFDLPPGAHWLARSDACPHQAFAIGPHLAMQFHIEVDADKVLRWAEAGDPKWADARARHPSVQDRDALVAGIPTWIEAHQRLADRVYETWLSALN